MLLALTTRHALQVQQANTNKIYLHIDLDKQLYMRVPEGIDGTDFAGKVLKLDCALYGLKQAGCVWNHRIQASLIGLGYSRTKSDACV